MDRVRQSPSPAPGFFPNESFDNGSDEASAEWLNKGLSLVDRSAIVISNILFDMPLRRLGTRTCRQTEPEKKIDFPAIAWGSAESFAKEVLTYCYEKISDKQQAVISGHFQEHVISRAKALIGVLEGKTSRHSGMESIGFVGGGSQSPWAISRRLLTHDDKAVSFPISLSDIDESEIKHEGYFLRFTTGSGWTPSTMPLSSSPFTDSYLSARSTVTDDNEEQVADLPWCSDRKRIFLYRIGQYNGLDSTEWRYDSIISFAVVGDENRPLVVVIQTAFRDETPDCFSSYTHFYPLDEFLPGSPVELDEYIYDQGDIKPMPIVHDWIVNDQCYEEYYERCIGPCKPSNRITSSDKPEVPGAVPIPKPEHRPDD